MLQTELQTLPGASAPNETIGLTTGQSAFLQAARSHPERALVQPYSLYTAANHQTWTQLFERMVPLWEIYATPSFLDGLSALALAPDRIPNLDDVNRRLAPLTGFRARAVAGYMPACQFFDCLRRREFPTTISIRPATDLDYLPEPDIFHDVAGHVPMHASPAFAQALVQFGECAHTLAAIARDTRNAAGLRRLSNGLKAMSRLFWFTVEFGLMRAPKGSSKAAGSIGVSLKAGGSGLLSSHGELRHAIESSDVRREAFSLDRVINQSFAIDHYQPLLFVLDSFDQLYEAAAILERSILDGTLAEVAPGEPETSADDLAGFLAHGRMAVQ